MAAAIARLYAELGLRDSGFKRGLDQAAEATQRTARSIGSSLKNLGGTLTAGATLPIVGAFTLAVNAASDLNETLSKTEAVFGTNAAAVEKWGESAATSVGLSKQAALEATATIGNLLKGVGVANDDLPKFSENIIQAAADLGSFNNVDPAQVVEDLRSGLVGEAEPLRKYGILLNEAAVKAEGMRLGLADANGELSEGAKVQARYSLIMKQLGNAQGDFAKTSGGLANRTRILRAQFQDIAAKIGMQLLPLAIRLATVASNLLDRFSRLSPRTQKFLVIVLGIVAALGPALLIVGQLVTAISALAPVLSLLLGPLGLVIAALVLFAIAYKKNWLGIRDITNRVVGWLVRQFGRIANILKGRKSLHDAIKDLPVPLQKVAILVRRLVVLFGDLLHGRWGKIREDLDKIGHTFGNLLKSLGLNVTGQQFKRFFSQLLETFSGVITLVGDLIHGRWSKIWGDLVKVVKDVLKLAVDWVLLYIGPLRDAFSGIFAAFQSLDWNQIGNLLWMGLQAAVVFLVTTGVPWLMLQGIALVQALWDGMRGFWGDTVRPWLNERLNAIVKALGDWYSAALGWGASLINGIWDGMTRLWGNVFSWLQENLSPSGLVRAFGNWYEAAYGWGQSLAAGIANGIASGIGWIADQIRSIEDHILDLWNFLQHPHSPSPLTRGWGKSIALGVAVGIGDGMKDVHGAVSRLNGAIGAQANARASSLTVRPVTPAAVSARANGAVASRTQVFHEGAIKVYAAENPEETAKAILRRIRYMEAGAA